MTTQQIEAMKQAIEALKKGHYYMIDAGLPNQSLLNEAFTAYKALEKALEEHAMREVQRLGQEIEQEPVKITHKHEWFRTGEMKVGQMRCISCGTWGQEEAPQRKPLTEDELADLWYKQSLDWLEFARAIEAAHGIKETT